MRNSLTIALATAAFVLSATSASAAVTLVKQTGPDLDTKIYASGDAGFATLNQPLVYGNTSPGAGHDVQFSGYTSFGATGTPGTATNVSITGGNGFASVSDANYTNPTGQNPSPATNDLFALLVNPDANFYLYEFSISQQSQGTVSVYYDLSTAGDNFILATGSPILSGNGDTQFIFGDASNSSLSIDKILITSSTAIFQIKQNSMQLTGTVPAVPEPGTWAMMLLGFGGMGVAMRRSRRRSGAKMMQLA